VFLFSIEQVRDPGRDYEIHLMKNLAGFDRHAWRTGFTNYRFAIPELAGRTGRAIYNDVDQIYLDDPAKLFDLPLDGHGYLAVSAEDTSVMLIDCARMARDWNLETACTRSKSQLLRAGQAPDLWGPLEGRWNARDTEFPRSQIRLLHYTALHLQPWQPFPESYSYHDHPLGDLWLDLERRADTVGYQPFSCRRPSPRFPRGRQGKIADAAPAIDGLREFVTERGATSVAMLGISPPAPAQALAASQRWHTFEHIHEIEKASDVVVVSGLAEGVPAEDVPWLLETVFAGARLGVFVAVNAVPACSEATVDVGRTLRTPAWWQEQLERVGRRYPGVAWRLDVSADGHRQTIVADPALEQASVWILEGHRLGDVLQLRRIADALGWPYRSIRLRYNPLHIVPSFLLGETLASVKNPEVLAPPWPDVVIASGKRSSSAARWIKRQSGGRTRIVNVGRPWSRLDVFDLIVTTPQYRLPARRNTLHLSLPITSRTRSELAAVRRASVLPELPGPRIAVLVGGNSTSCSLNQRAAAALGRMANEVAARRGGSLLISGSPRTPRSAFRALVGAVSVPHYAWEYGQQDRKNPYLEFLASADEILVTGDSVSMLADALATGRPVRVFSLPPSLLARVVSSLQAPFAWWRRRRKTYRGTPKQQGPISRWYDRMVDRGLLTPARDLDYLHGVLTVRGLVNGGSSRADQESLADDELCQVVERIHCLLHDGLEVRSA
ncbi:MAG: ELM1/GtrOC1 family putative glycosyltransferase, partial [Pseudomonadales bacterium]|jgi:hypothetical protein